MYQLVPVALETKLYSERLARWQYLFHLVGFTGMVWMFWTWNMKGVGHFGTVLAIGVALFVYNLVRTLWRVARWNVVALAVASALVWLSLAILAGLTIAAAKCSYESAETSTLAGAFAGLIRGLKQIAVFMAQFDQFSAMHAHAHLGAVGVFIMLIVGISYKLVPMFTLSEMQSPWRARASLALLNAGLLGAFFAILLRSRLKPAFALAAVLGLAVYAIEIIAILRARKRRTLDWGVKCFLTALGLLAPVSVLAVALSWPGLPLTAQTGQLENLYGFLAFAGVISLAIIGMLYKIVPFLVWYGSYSRHIGLNKVPSLADLYSARLQVLGYWSFLAGLAIASSGIVLARAPAVRCGAALLGLSLVALWLNVAQMLRHLVRPELEPLPARPATGAKLPGLLAQPAGSKAEAERRISIGRGGMPEQVGAGVGFGAPPAS